MDYIVFDLEWNQSPNGKRFSENHLPFEIIEIGAVKLNSEKKQTDTFHRLIKPSVYHWIHRNIHDVIHVDIRELRNGVPFPEAVRDFLNWCGEEYVFCTWGNQDVMELQRNMHYYDLLSLLPGPVVYYDVQKLFAYEYEEPSQRRSLEYAADHLSIKKDQAFHRALSDAEFTAKVMQQISPDTALRHPSLDVYQHPISRKEEIKIEFPDSIKYISREFDTREDAMKDRHITATHCPLCGHNARRKIRWFTPNGKVYFSTSFCQEHGIVAGKIRICKAEDGRCFTVKSIKCPSQQEYDEILRKKEQARLKKMRLKKAGS